MRRGYVQGQPTIYGMRLIKRWWRREAKTLILRMADKWAEMHQGDE